MTNQNPTNELRPLVHYLDATAPLDCLYGYIQLFITGGDGGIANVHVVTISESSSHLQSGYDKVFYLLPGTGSIAMGDDTDLQGHSSFHHHFPAYDRRLGDDSVISALVFTFCVPICHCHDKNSMTEARSMYMKAYPDFITISFTTNAIPCPPRKVRDFNPCRSKEGIGMKTTNASTRVTLFRLTGSLFLSVVSACSVTAGFVQQGVAQDATLTGTWYHEGGAAERAQRYDAIDRATEGMHSLMRGRARDKLRAKTAPQSEIAINDEGGRVTISTRARRVTFATDGSPTRVPLDSGAGTIQAKRQEGQLVVTARGQNGAQTTVYRLSDDRTRLTLDISINNNIFEKPLRYQVEYLNAARRRTSTSQR
jgi:hypothetical protein